MRRHTAAERRKVLHVCLLSATVAASNFVAATLTAATLALAAAVVALAAAGFDYNDWELLCRRRRRQPLVRPNAPWARGLR